METYQRFVPGYVSTDGHAHKVQEETCVVLSGSGRIKLDDEVVELRQWDVVRVAPRSSAAPTPAPTISSCSRSASTSPRRVTASLAGLHRF
jgi:Cupin domain